MNPNHNKYPATIIKIIDKYRVVINRGSSHGVRLGQRFLIYSLSEEELIDPETGESLGRLELVKGTGKTIHVQEKMSTIESDIKKSTKKRKIIKKPSPFMKVVGFSDLLGEVEEIIEDEEFEPFKDVEIGDKAKPI